LRRMVRADRGEKDARIRTREEVLQVEWMA
jgi:hypothetical protein